MLFRRKFGTIRNTRFVLYIRPNVFISFSRRKISVRRYKLFLARARGLIEFPYISGGASRGDDEKSEDAPCIHDNKFYRNPNSPAHNIWSPTECAKYYLCLGNCPDYVSRVENNFSTGLLSTDRQRGVRVQMLPGIVVRRFQAGVRLQSERRQLRRDVRYDF